MCAVNAVGVNAGAVGVGNIKIQIKYFLNWDFRIYWMMGFC